MERRDIEIFLVVAEELHFSRAAQRLHVSPARVSQTMKAMERRIGAALFERTSRRVALTAIGQRLDDDLRAAHEQFLAGIERAVRAPSRPDPYSHEYPLDMVALEESSTRTIHNASRPRKRSMASRPSCEGGGGRPVGPHGTFQDRLMPD